MALSYVSEAKRSMIAQGAESKIFRVGDKLVKERVKKSYRVKPLDDFIRKHRTKVEAGMLRRVAKLINVPRLISVSGDEIVMDYVDAPVLRDVISIVSDDVLISVGLMVAKLHANNIIHGDLTTSNILVKDSFVFLIDFGLSEVKPSLEAKAVDLHVLKQALEAKHFVEFKRAWKLISDSYVGNYAEGKGVLDRLRLVESRGRYKLRV